MKKSEKLNPIHLLLKKASIYKIVQNFLSKKGTSEFLYKTFPEISTDDWVLDLGCGPARMRHLMPTKYYVGMDFNPSHINEAKKNHPEDTFICDNIVTYSFDEHQKFDKILMMGVLHHLSDDEAKSVLASSLKLLKDGGKIIAVDALFEMKQNPISRLLAKLDQGNFVRYSDQYINLVKPIFKDVTVLVKKDLMRFPYLHHLMTCTK